MVTGKKRIALNVVATYGRSLYAMAVGLFTSRWVLEALGHVDYGLVGVVGGLTGLVSFINGLLAQPSDALFGALIGASVGVLLLVIWASSGLYPEYSNLVKIVAPYVQ